jgi:4-amino-4-deoxy-L-arabinose transferase-like glycosyltransferase
VGIFGESGIFGRSGNFRRSAPLLAGLAGLTVLRLVVAAWVPLSPDEAYYWVWSRALAPGYLDHPPMVALWIRAGVLLVGDTALGVRLLGPVSVALASLLLADAAARLLPGREAGWRAAALLNATLLVGAGAVIMTPDTPLLFFWTVALWALARIATGGGGGWFAVLGLAGGLALASKYTAALLGAGVGAWLALTPRLRFWLARPAPWLALVLAGAVFLPVILWNAEHGWAGFFKQGGRVGSWEPDRALIFLGELAGGQIGLATPLIFLFCAAGAVFAVRRAWSTGDPGWVLLAVLTLLPAAVFVQHAFGDRVQGNWPAILYPSAAIAAAGLDGNLWRRLFRPALALGFAITTLVYLQAALALFPLPAKVDPVTRLLRGWPDLAEQIAAAARREGAEFVAADQYGIAAELARAPVIAVPVLATGQRWGLFALPAAPVEGRQGLLVRSLRRGEDVDTTPWTGIAEIGRVSRADAGGEVEGYRLYRVRVRRGGAPVVVLPRPD